MGDLVPIHQKRNFTLEDATELLPIIRRMTQRASEEVRTLSTQLSYAKEKEKKAELEKRIHEVFQNWYRKVCQLGCDAKGMWLVDFDTGEGYYCWHYPETTVEFFHGYSDGFRGRTKIH